MAVHCGARSSPAMGGRGARLHGSRSATVLRMETIQQKELRNNVAEVLRRAEAGEQFTITVAGRPVAQLGPTSLSRRRYLAASRSLPSP